MTPSLLPNKPAASPPTFPSKAAEQPDFKQSSHPQPSKRTMKPLYSSWYNRHKIHWITKNGATRWCITCCLSATCIHALQVSDRAGLGGLNRPFPKG